MTNPVLHVRDLAVSYAGGVRALHGVSLSVPEGKVVAVLGGNGAGKSTLLRAISGTLPFSRGTVDRGSIELAGRRLDGIEAARIVRAGVVQVPEGREIFEHLTVEENLRAGGISVDRRARRAGMDRAYEMFPVLRERRTQRAGLLSGGEQQMLAIGRALMTEPRLLLLDEPSLGLAPQAVERIAEAIGQVNLQGTSVVLVEQNAGLALQLADEAYVLEVGKVVLHGPAAELAADPEVQGRYLGIGTTTAVSPPHEKAAEPAEVDGAAPHELLVEGLSVRFGGIAALSDVTFRVRPGSVHALIGPNGAGKSSCLNAVNGIYRAEGGNVRYGDHELTRLRPHQIARLGVGRTFQNLALSATATVAQNMLLGRHRLSRAGFVTAGLRTPHARREEAEQARQVRRIAELLELDDLLDRPVGALPYGDRKRVELGRALCMEPTLLLLDEPVAGMTPQESERLARVLRRSRAELGISILLVEHDMGFVMGLADRVTVLDFGRRIADGAPAEIQRDPVVVRAYLGPASRRPEEGA